MNVFAFDIETVPDTAAGARVHGLDALADQDVAAAMRAMRRARTGGSDFLPHHLHRVAVISIAACIGDRFRIFSLGGDGETEPAIVQRFFDGLDRYRPQLVSWNGGGFDLPVLHYRALRHGIQAPCYWESGQNERSFRWNNYLNRFHEGHLDLMDVLAGYQLRAAAPLDEVAALCGLPGKMGMAGGDVQDAVAAGEIDAVRRYCEVDALNTYLLFLRFEYMRGHLDDSGYSAACERIRLCLSEMAESHTSAFLDAWQTQPTSEA
jgi:predicted PolB exonuclease-like 3'-5' exonuclease